MDIDEIMDCAGCESYRFHPGRTWGDPDRCYPDEGECLEGSLETGKPCQRMLDAIFDWIHDGQFSTHSGEMFTGELLCDKIGYGREILENYGIPDGRYDFAAADYWWLPYGENCEPIPYKDEAEIYREWFR